MADLYQLHLLMEKDLLQPHGKFILRKMNYVETIISIIYQKETIMHTIYIIVHTQIKMLMLL